MSIRCFYFLYPCTLGTWKHHNFWCFTQHKCLRTCHIYYKKTRLSSKKKFTASIFDGSLLKVWHPNSNFLRGIRKNYSFFARAHAQCATRIFQFFQIFFLKFDCLYFPSRAIFQKKQISLGSSTTYYYKIKLTLPLQLQSPRRRCCKKFFCAKRIFWPINFLSRTSYIQSEVAALKLVPIYQASPDVVPSNYERNRFTGSTGSYGPSNAKMTIFSWFSDFRQRKSLQINYFYYILRIEKSLPFQRYQIYYDWPSGSRVVTR